MATAPGPPEYHRVPSITSVAVLHPGKTQQLSQVSSVFLVYSQKKTLFVLAQRTLRTLQVYGEFFQANYTTHLSQCSFLSDVL